MDLNGRRILILRPQALGETLAKEIESKGGKAFVFPTLKIVPVDMDAAALEKGAQWLAQCDWIIWLSQQAVYHLPTPWHTVLTDLDIHMVCIGPATGAALNRGGFKDALIFPAGSTSEMLLNSAAFSIENIKNKKIALLSGVGGRTILFDSLKRNGAEVCKLEVYQREIPNNQLSAEHLLKWGLNSLYVTSGESLSNLLLLVDEEAQCILKSVEVLVISQRLKAYAKSLGFDKVTIIEIA